MPDAPTPGQSLWDMTGWREVTCEESDQRRTEPRTVLSTLTDPDGIYGPASARRFQQHLDAMVKL